MRSNKRMASCHPERRYKARGLCKPCYEVSRRQKNPLAQLNASRWSVCSRHGLTPSAFDRMVKKQKGLCAICKMPPTGKHLVIDHNHATGTIRSLLCQACNKGLGFFRDSVPFLHSAARYITRHTK